jgi:hypothetical protein
MMNGVVCQLLWSLLRVWRVTVCEVQEGQTLLQPQGVTIILEPSEGGDLEVPGAVEQIKARSTGRPWSLEDVIRGVLPDLYRACRTRERPTIYRFVAEGEMGPWEDVYHFFRSLRTRAFDAREPLTALDDEHELASVQQDRALSRKIREAGGRPTERGLFLYIARVLAGDDKSEKGTGRRRRKLEDPPEVLQRNLLRLLGSFELKGDQQWSAVENEVRRELSARGVKNLEEKLDALIGNLLRRAREGAAVVEREAFLAQHGLQALPLHTWDLILRESQLFLRRVLRLRDYKASEDCRERRPLLSLLQAGTGEPVVAWGESGQGKSWLLYGTAQELAHRGEVVLVLDSTQDVLRDREEAARLFCERIWGTDERYSLDRLAQRVRREVPDLAGRPWLTVLIDGVRDRSYLAQLIRQEWEEIGIRVAVAFTTETREPDRLEGGVLPLPVRDFSHREVLSYLRLRLGAAALLPPQDILRLLRHPLWARLSCDLVLRGGSWQADNEYQLIEGYWTGQAAHAPMATDALIELASRLLEGEDYPWPLSRLRAMGIGDFELDLLFSTHLVSRVQGGRRVELWHDRLLQWAVAEGLVAGLQARRLTSEALRARVRSCIEGEERRRFGYVPMDVLWLMADPTVSREQDVLGLMEMIEEFDGLFAQISTLGGRIVPHIFARLRQIAGDSSYLEIRYLEMLESMSDPSIAGFAVEMLNEDHVRLQKIAARILATHGSPEALDRLWALYRAWSAEVEARDEVGAAQESEVDFHDVVQVDEALGSCVSQAALWLEGALRAADPAVDPVHTLVFLIPKVEQGKDLWLRVKKVAFEKVRPTHERSLAFCIAYFLDFEEVPWLEARANGKGDRLAPLVRKGLYLLSPKGALQPIDLEAESDLYWGRFWWLQPLQNEYPQKTSALLLETIRAAEQPWHAAVFYGGREDWMSEEALNLLLDATNEILVRELAEPSPDRHDPLWLPFSRLKNISHPDLLKLFWRRRGTDLERNLSAWLILQGPTDDRGPRLTPEAGVLVLRKIAGEGLAEVANSYLETATTHLGREEGCDLAQGTADEKTIDLLTQIAFQEEEQPTISGRTHPLDQRDALLVLADHAQDETVVRGVIRWGLQLPPDFERYLNGRVLGDTKLAPALEALSFTPIPPGAILALGMCRRPEMEAVILDVLARVEPASQQSLACLLALETLNASSEASLQAFRRGLDVPEHRFVARRFLDRMEARSATEETYSSAARRVWERRNDPWGLLRNGESLEVLSYLDTEEVREYLREHALSEARGGRPSGHFDAIRALMKLDPDSAFEAARHQIARGSKKDRKLYPQILIEVDEARALNEFARLLREEDDFVLICSIGEALDRASNRSPLLRWLGDPDPKLREGACIAAEAMRWSADLDEALFALRRDEDWDTREAAWEALEKVRLQKEVDRLVAAFQAETDRARRWCLLDAALDLGYPGVVRGYGRFGWFSALQETESLPYSMRKHALKRLEKHREELLKTLEKRK